MVKPKTRRRIRRFALVAFILFALTAGLGWHFWSSRNFTPPQMLQHVVEIENTGIDENNAQTLGWMLAMLGRDDEVRELDFFPQFELPPLEMDEHELHLSPVPWRDALKQIAAEHRIVMIMEDHSVSKHREMIGATLPTFRDAGFTHFAVEAVGESAKALAFRGYPAGVTGVYTADPQFGNALRQAMELKFKVLGYDFGPSNHDGREEFAANKLAKVVNKDPHAKLLVHAGGGHVLKYETKHHGTWLAAILWEKTGIEPFTIWQWSAAHDSHEYRVVADAVAKLQAFDEPVLLMPPPSKESGLRDVPRVDAILVHPPDQSVAPANRTTLFPNDMQRVAGQWATKQWPVIIAAYRNDEPITAIPLDQVMLRDSEQEFTLWVPRSTDFEIVVFDQQGVLQTSSESGRDSIVVRAE